MGFGGYTLFTAIRQFLEECPTWEVSVIISWSNGVIKEGGKETMGLG